MYNDLLNIAKERRAIKIYDDTKNIDKDTLEKIFKFTQTAPHSLGLELTRLISIDRESIYREDVINGLLGFNQDRARGASNIVLMITKKEDFVSLENEDFIKSRVEVVKYAVEASGTELIGTEIDIARPVAENDWANNGNNNEEWLARQAYIQLGYLMLGAKTLGVDSTPVEGFGKELTEILIEKELIEENERATLVVLLGYSSNDEGSKIGDKQFRREYSKYIEYK